jgi:hypothetical protein
MEGLSHSELMTGFIVIWYHESVATTRFPDRIVWVAASEFIP